MKSKKTHFLGVIIGKVLLTEIATDFNKFK